MPHLLRVRVLPICLLAMAAVSPGIACAYCAVPTAVVISAEGSVSARTGLDGPWTAAHPDAGLCEGDTVLTGRNSRAAIRFTGADTLIRLDQSTTLRIVSPSVEAGAWRLDLLGGAARFFSRVSRRLRIGTPFMNALVDGTEFLVRVDTDQSTVDLFEGTLRVVNEQGELRLYAGQGARATRGQAPRLYKLLDPVDAVQWAISYEPMLSALLWSGREDHDPELNGSLPGLLREAHRLLLAGDAQAAFASLDAVPPARRDAAFYNYRAALFLSLGRVDSARADLATARGLAPGNGDSDAIASSIALGLNDQKRALALARAATAAGPQRPLPWFALSYAEQAAFDLPAARAAMDKSLAVDPHNGLLRARLAELLLALGELDAAQKAADAAVAAAPQAALAHRVQGFAALLRIDLNAAQAAFERALALDAADPITHLGLGLTRIRSGHLAQGRTQFEIAVALDPLVSLLRTYLGKAYYDERRDTRAETAFAIASGLDPRDPTPWLYRAIQLRTANRPVEALEALETSLALNGYRAQFRPTATLDADAAARTEAVGQIYRDLHFDQVALIQGFSAVTQAPDDQSGHRLLAEVYSALPRHEEARVSELLQAQLLQPLTRSPVLPLQGETRLLVPDVLGPLTLGLNEYGPLFNRNGAGAWVTLLGGSRATLGDEVLASALYDRAAFSLGQYRFQTEGSGGVRAQTQDIQVGFAQAQLSPDTGVQLELRNTDTNEGPYLDEYNATARDHTRSSSTRLGLTQRWSPGSVLIASFIHRRIDEDSDSSGLANPTDPQSLEVFSASNPTEGWSAEVRQDWRSERLLLSFGTSWFAYETQADFADAVTARQQEGVFRSTLTSDYRLDNRLVSIWFYGTWRPVPRLDLTLGLNWESMQWDERRLTANKLELLDPDLGWVPLDSGAGPQATDSKAPIEQLNPKLGLSWRPLPGTTLRAAALRTLRGPDGMKQTIEPTQVAGFNQLFDGYLGERAWRYGIGIDQRVSDRLYMGAEGSRRDVSVPEIQLGGGTIFTARRERFVRAYAAFTPSPQLALSAEYFYEENVLRLQDNAEDRTNRLPLTLSYFNPNGLFGSIRGTYVWQSTIPSGLTSPVSEAFWNLDLSVGFRLPRRLGLIVLSIDNLLDEKIPFRETDPNHPLFVGERVLSLRTTVQF